MSKNISNFFFRKTVFFEIFLLFLWCVCFICYDETGPLPPQMSGIKRQMRSYHDIDAPPPSGTQTEADDPDYGFGDD